MSEEYQKLVVEVLYNMEPTSDANEALDKLRQYINDLHFNAALLKYRLTNLEKSNVDLLKHISELRKQLGKE